MPVLVLLRWLVGVLKRRVGALDPGWELDRWARDRGYRILSALPSSRSDDVAVYDVAVVDRESVEHVGTARVPLNTLAGDVQVQWRAEEQLDWRVYGGREPWSSDNGVAEGWCADPGGHHEQRWFSGGTPTDLVRDGRVESRDPISPDTRPPAT